MARALRIQFPGAWYHVTSRGNERRRIFVDERDNTRFLEILKETLALYRVELHVFVLMGNHYHLVIHTPLANLHPFMQRLNTAYSVYFNRRHGRVGHLFQGRYKAILIEADSYLLELSRYVHLNPIRIRKHSGLGTDQKRRIIERYRWCSFGGYVSLRRRLPLVTHAKLLEMVGGGDDRVGRRRYGEFVLSGIGGEAESSLWDDVRGGTVLGSDGFVEWVYEHFVAGRGVDSKEVPAVGQLRVPSATIEELARAVAAAFDMDDGSLFKRRAAPAVARSVFLELCRVHLSGKMSLTQLGRQLGEVSAAAFSQNKKRLAERMREDEALGQLFERLAQRKGGQSSVNS